MMDSGSCPKCGSTDPDKVRSECILRPAFFHKDLFLWNQARENERQKSGFYDRYKKRRDDG